NCCVVPESVRGWVSVGHSNGTRPRNPRGPIPCSSTKHGCGVHGFPGARSRWSRPAQSWDCTHLETLLPSSTSRSATAQVAVAFDPLHLSERTPRCSQVLDVTGNMKFPR